MAQKMRVMFFLALMLMAVYTTAGAAQDVTHKTVKLEVDGGAARTIMTYLTTVEELLESEGIEVDSKDILNVELEDRLSNAMPTRIRIQRGYYINLVINGEAERFKVLPEAKVGHVVAELKEKRGLDYFYKDGYLNEILEPEQEIFLYSSDTKIEKSVEPIPFYWEAVYDEEREDDEQIVVREGEYGEKTVTYEVQYIGDEEVARIATSEVTTKEPVNKIVSIGKGTKKGQADEMLSAEESPATVSAPKEAAPTATTSVNTAPVRTASTEAAMSLEAINAIVAREMGAQAMRTTVDMDNSSASQNSGSQQENMQAAENNNAFPTDLDEFIISSVPLENGLAAAPTVMSIPADLYGTMMTPFGKIEYVNILVMEASAYSPEQEGMSEYTASGIKAEHGVVAVDPEVIPLGTTIYIEGYGIAIAADTGSAIQENMIDLCFETIDECLVFGRKEVMVYIMK